MIPYIHVPSWTLGPVTIHPFGVLVAIAVLVGTSLAARRARTLGLDAEKLRSFVTWMLVGGFVGGHVIDALLYRPMQMLAEPWRLLEIWKSQGSFGGFLGALIAVVLWRRYQAIDWLKTPLGSVPGFQQRSRPEPVLPFADLVLSVFPVAWIFGRAGCAVAHDHPGTGAEPGSLLAVAAGPYDRAAVTRLPLGIELRYGTDPHWDLGTLELAFTIVLAAALAATWKRKLPTGWYVAAVSVAYAPVRFAMDFLRVRNTSMADARYGALTPAQWACVALLGFGLWLAMSLTSTRWRGWSRCAVAARSRPATHPSLNSTDSPE